MARRAAPAPPSRRRTLASSREARRFARTGGAGLYTETLDTGLLYVYCMYIMTIQYSNPPAVAAPDEPLDDRFNGRISRDTKRLIERAAAAVDMTASAYMVQASRERALHDLQIIRISKLGSERIAAILAEAEEDDEPNDALVAAVRRHRAV